MLACSRAGWGAAGRRRGTTPLTISVCEWNTYTNSGRELGGRPAHGRVARVRRRRAAGLPAGFTTPNTPGPRADDHPARPVKATVLVQRQGHCGRLRLPRPLRVLQHHDPDSQRRRPVGEHRHWQLGHKPLQDQLSPTSTRTARSSTSPSSTASSQRRRCADWRHRRQGLHRCGRRWRPVVLPHPRLGQVLPQRLQDRWLARHRACQPGEQHRALLRPPSGASRAGSSRAPSPPLRPWCRLRAAAWTSEPTASCRSVSIPPPSSHRELSLHGSSHPCHHGRCRHRAHRRGARAALRPRGRRPSRRRGEPYDRLRHQATVVPAGTSLKEAVRLELITETQVAAAALPAGALTTDRRRPTAHSLALTDIPPGQYVLAAAFGETPDGRARDPGARRQARGLRAAEDPARVGTFVTPGSITVFMPATSSRSSTRARSPRPSTSRTSRAPRSCSTTSRSSPWATTPLTAGAQAPPSEDGEAATADQAPSFLVTLAVTPEQATRLVHGINKYTLYAGPARRRGQGQPEAQRPTTSTICPGGSSEHPLGRRPRRPRASTASRSAPTPSARLGGDGRRVPCTTTPTSSRSSSARTCALDPACDLAEAARLDRPELGVILLRHRIDVTTLARPCAAVSARWSPPTTTRPWPTPCDAAGSSPRA